MYGSGSKTLNRMSTDYEELDFRPTPIGDLMLRRRRMPEFGDLDIHEVKLGEEFLMTSLFHEAERQLAKLGLAAVERDGPLDAVVGGLGLGYTAVSALEDPRIGSLVVVEFLDAVIDWHREGLVPLGETLCADPRCHLLQADFFALARDIAAGFDPGSPGRRFDAVLLDIDHTPSQVLAPGHARFYTAEGLRELIQHLKPGGVFALWADGRPDEAFTGHLADIFAHAEAHTIEFDNPITGGTSAGAVYVASP